MEARASWACGHPWEASFQEQVPRASSQEEEDPSSASWEGLPCGVQASCQGEEDQGDWGEAGSWPLQEEEQRMELEVSFLVEMQPCFVNQVLGLLFHPFLVVVFHVLLVLPTAAVRLSHRWRIMGKIRITVVTINFGMLLHRPLATRFLLKIS